MLRTRCCVQLKGKGAECHGERRVSGKDSAKKRVSPSTEGKKMSRLHEGDRQWGRWGLTQSLGKEKRSELVGMSLSQLLVEGKTIRSEKGKRERKSRVGQGHGELEKARGHHNNVSRAWTIGPGKTKPWGCWRQQQRFKPKKGAGMRQRRRTKDCKIVKIGKKNSRCPGTAAGHWYLRARGNKEKKMIRRCHKDKHAL